MLNIRHFTDLVVVPALQTIRLDSEAARELLLGTALKESGLRHLRQLGGGPARGVYQMEPATHDSIWADFLAYQGDLSSRVRSLVLAPTSNALVGNLWYATAMARIRYYWVSDPLPAAGDIEAQAAYWKQHYNTPDGAGTVEEYLDVWRTHMEGSR